MFIATLPPKTLARLHVPKPVLTLSDGYAVSTFYDKELRIPFGADCWITCRGAMPHDDAGVYSHVLFLTLCVRSGRHRFCDVAAHKQGILERTVLKGDIFVVDPVDVHWLIDYVAAQSSKTPSLWVGLQWELPRDTAREQARRILQAIGAVPRNCIDRRYADWYAPTHNQRSGE